MTEVAQSFEGLHEHAGSVNAPMSPREFVTQAYREFKESIFRHAVFIGADVNIGEELTHEAFLKLYVASRDGQKIENVRGWLITVVTHLWLNHCRASGTRLVIAVSDADEWLECMADPGANPQALLLARERTQILRDTIAGLTTDQKLCLFLRAEGLRYREISNVTGIGMNTVASLLHRAIESIRKVAHED
jgi:RNA polymerase sigma-70 factor (ECF subfamily)